MTVEEARTCTIPAERYEELQTIERLWIKVWQFAVAHSALIDADDQANEVIGYIKAVMAFAEREKTDKRHAEAWKLVVDEVAKITGRPPMMTADIITFIQHQEAALERYRKDSACAEIVSPASEPESTVVLWADRDKPTEAQPQPAPFFPALEVPCPACNGCGLPSEFGYEHACNYCAGTAYRVTAEGLRVLEFLKRHWK